MTQSEDGAAVDSAGGALMNPFSTIGVPQPVPAPAATPTAADGDWLLPLFVFALGMMGIRRMLRGML